MLPHPVVYKYVTCVVLIMCSFYATCLLNNCNFVVRCTAVPHHLCAALCLSRSLTINERNNLHTIMAGYKIVLDNMRESNSWKMAARLFGLLAL